MISILLAALLTSASAFGAEPVLPEAPPEEQDDCKHAWDLVPGKPWPTGLGTAQGPSCRATALPTWQFRDYRNQATWGAAHADWSAIQIASLQVERDAALRELELVTPKWYERPAPVALGTAIMVVATVYLAAWGWGEVTHATP